MFTVITEGNKVRQYHGVEYLYEVRKTEKDYMIVNDTGEVEVYVGNPINWPTDAKNGMQAIVDVKEGTLRFGHDELIGLTELVVSEYVESVDPVTSVEDRDPATAKQFVPKGKGNPILGMVLADLTNRALEGKEKYGEPLLANNGRNALWDAYQEALDLAMYLRQAIEEQERS